MPQLEPKYTSSFITSRIPTFIQDEYGTFVAFVKAFYEWAEQQDNTDYHIDNIVTYQDVDKTIQVFLDQFRDQFLLNFPHALAKVQHAWSPTGELSYTDLRKLIKNVRHFYEGKGTENSVKFLFRVLYNSLVEVEYPKTKILNTSSGNWTRLSSIKVSYYDPIKLQTLPGREIREVNYSTGDTVAKAKVESITQSNFNGLNLSELFLSSVQGSFTGNPLEFDSEEIRLTISISDPYDGLNYTVGDTVYLVESTLPIRDITSKKLASGTIVSWTPAPKGYPGTLLVVSPDSGFENFKQGISPILTNESGSIQYEFSYVLTSYVTLTGIKIQPTITTISVKNGGEGHVLGEEVIISSAPGDYGTGAIASVSKVDLNGAITKIALTSFGSNYNSTPTVQCSLSATEASKLYNENQYATSGDPSLRGAIPYLTPSIKSWIATQITTGPMTIDYTDSTLTSAGYTSGSQSQVYTILVRSIQASSLSSINKSRYEAAVVHNSFSNLSAFDRGSLIYAINSYTLDLVKSQIGATATASIGYVGVYPGYYKNSDNLLSSTSKLQDNHYYQSYSYVLNTEVAFDRFAQNIRELVHPAGMVFFGRPLLTRSIYGTYTFSDRVDLIEVPIIEFYAGYSLNDTADRVGQVVSGISQYHHPNKRIPYLVNYKAQPSDYVYTVNSLTDSHVPGFSGWRIVGHGNDGANVRGTRPTDITVIQSFLNSWYPTDQQTPAIMKPISTQTRIGEIPIGAFLTMRLGGGPDSLTSQYSSSGSDSTHQVTLSNDSAYSYPTS